MSVVPHRREAAQAAVDDPEQVRRGNAPSATKAASALAASPAAAWPKPQQPKPKQPKRDAGQSRLAQRFANLKENAGQAQGGLAQRLASLTGKTAGQTKQATQTAVSAGKLGFTKAAQIGRETVLPEISRTGSWLRQRTRRDRLRKDYRDFLVWLHETVLDPGIESLLFAPTKGHVPLDGLTIKSRNRAFGHDYRPSPRFVFEWVLSAIPEDVTGFNLIDYGAGKGRVLLLAAQYPFKMIGGVEFAEELHDAASMNIQQFPRSRMRCRNVECLHADAVNLGAIDGETIFYLYNPFSREVLAEVLKNIAASYHERPRRLYLVMVDSSDGDLVMQTGIFAKFKQSWFDRLRMRLLSPYPIAIYRSLA